MNFLFFRDFSGPYVADFLKNSRKWPNLSGKWSKIFRKSENFKIRLYQALRNHKNPLENQNGGYWTYQCREFFAQEFQFFNFWGHFPILKGKNTRKGAKSVMSLLGRRCIFSNSVKSSITPIIQILRCVKIKEI